MRTERGATYTCHPCPTCSGTQRYLASSRCVECERRKDRERRGSPTERPGLKEHGAPCAKNRQHRDETGRTLRYVVGGRCVACECARANAAYHRRISTPLTEDC